MILLGLGAIVGLFVLYRRVFMGGAWISPMILISFLVSIMGVIAEIIIRTSHESQGKPICIVKSMASF